MCLSVPLKPERHHHVARSEDGRLFYDNKWYSRGQAICINRKDEYPIRCVCVCVFTHMSDFINISVPEGDLSLKLLFFLKIFLFFKDALKYITK